MAAVLAWCFTSAGSPLPMHRLVRSKLAGYMGWSGLWQGWTMFAPNPPMVNSYLEAEIAFDDGTDAIWVFPRMDRLGYFERYWKERYRKWAHERLMRFGRPDPMLCDAAARFAARQAARPGRRAQTVNLVRYWSDVPHPARRQAHLGTASAGWTRETIFTSRPAPVADAPNGGRDE